MANKTEVIRAVAGRGVDYELSLISCGKKNCGKCPHGPYWYARIRIGKGRSARRYIGKEIPTEVAELDNAAR